MNGNTKDLAGERFGRWRVLEYSYSEKKIARWLCECDCGTRRVVNGNGLRMGDSRSCGCLRREILRKHNMSLSPEYIAWRSMIQRTSYPKHISYKYYGARGIRVCEEWRNSFEAFFAHIGPRPTPTHTVDRIHNVGNYEPGNVKWSTITEQNRHKSNNRYLTLHGKARLLEDWSRLTGLSKQTIAYRLKRGWSVERALTTVPAFNHPKEEAA
jgi:hypothetical protein